MKTTKKEKLILVGHGASGKDYLAEQLLEKGLIKSRSYTSRPQRPNEIDGDVYNFVSKEEFEEMINNGEFYEYELFKEDWYYGSTKLDWNICNLFIKTVGGVNQIREEDREGCFIVFLDISEKVRYQRLLERNDNNDDLKRRMDYDRKDFEGFEDYDLKITDEYFDSEMVFDLMD
ncbi:MAG: guanylate kinase [uncultured marine phage]|uniref:Guanylate kinase n=1 Tax=uncultured marine phage TaxID=707152 RepID=A0A8D9C8Y6_9VIRU|nr:MAG: guanylate kinase [uncultured marine phage]